MSKIKEISQEAQVIDLEIEQTEVLLDDLNEFCKGCTDKEQDTIALTLDILMDRISLLSEKRDNLL